MPEGAVSLTVPNKPDSVRIATPADEARLFALLQRLQECNFTGMPYAAYLPVDTHRLWGHVNAACRGQSGIAGVIDGPDGELVASVGIFAIQPWWSSAFYLCQHWLFVTPETRQSNYARDLFKFSEWHRADMSQRCGYDIPLETTVLSTDRLPAKERLWSGHAVKIGAVFWADGK